MKQFRRILNSVFALFLILVLVAAAGLEENSNYTKIDFNADFSEGWMLSQPDGSQTEITFPYAYPDDNPNIQISHTLPHVDDNAVLLVMCNYKAMTAYVDGEEIFYALPSTFGMVKTDMGHYVALIPLRAEHSGKEIQLHITERQSGYGTEVKYIRLTSAAQYAYQILEEQTFQLLTAFILILCSAAALIVWLILWVRKGTIPEETYHPLLWVCLFTATLGTWFFTEGYVWAISTGSFAANGTVSYLALSLMPVSLLGLLKSICSQKLESLRWIVIIAKFLAIGEWFLFLTGLVDFSGMLILLHLECVAAATIFAAFLAWKQELFLMGDVIRYGVWVLLCTLIITLFAYLRGGNWLFWALISAVIILGSVVLSIVVNLNKAIKEINQTMHYKEHALTDIMTGLKSRYAYSIFEAQHKVGYPSSSLTLIFIDIDKLKKINDKLGHIAGDEMIVAVSKCINEAFGDVAECFRMGGDEFLVSMTAEADVVQDRIHLFDQLISQWKGRYVDNLTVSYGIAAAREYPQLNFEDLLKAADEKMYQVKQHNRRR